MLDKGMLRTYGRKTEKSVLQDMLDQTSMSKQIGQAQASAAPNLPLPTFAENTGV